MGTWGTGLSSNDAFEDVYQNFMDLYNEGYDVAEISQRIQSTNIELQSDYEGKHSFWFALAKAQWECGGLDKDVFEKVKSIIDSGEDIRVWEELNGTSSSVKKRKQVLDELLDKISTPNAKVKKRKKLVIRQPIFQKGDCLVFELLNGNYGAVFVLEAEQDTEFGMNMLAITTIDQPGKPTAQDFENAYVLVIRDKASTLKYREHPCVTWCYAEFHKKAKTKFEIVGKLPVSKNYNSKEHCSMTSKWDALRSYINLQEGGRNPANGNSTPLKDWR